MRERRFASPAETRTPPGADGWQELYPYSMLYADEDSARFWFCDSQHWPEVLRPFDVTFVEYALKCLGQYNTRIWLIPSANGLDYRIHLGYVYLSPVAVPPEQVGARVPIFLERADFYFQNWTTLVDNWRQKVTDVIDELETLDFSPLPERVDTARVLAGRGLDNSYDLAVAYDRALQLAHQAWQYHFEFLNLGYAAYLDFFGFCRDVFPGITDQSVARMVQGIEVDLFRPDAELKRLAKLAVSLGVAGELKQGSVAEALVRVGQTRAGLLWLAEWERAKQPWFNYSAGNGFYSHDKVWIEHLEIPLGFLRGYMEKVEAGVDIDRPIAAIAAERKRLSEEYGSLLDAESQAIFQSKLSLARTVFPYVENHNFYIEHWAHSVFWRKMRSLGHTLAGAGFFAVADDLFYLRREELIPAISDYASGWATGAGARGGAHWRPEIERRRSIIAALKTQRPASAFNEPPATITEPFTIMLWGITTERIDQWLQHDTQNRLKGMAASPGIAEGTARVIHSADELENVQEGEILIAPITAPSWATVFAKIRAIVTDIGGVMSHAAIVCREYGLPAVTGVGNATQIIRTGQRVRVDGAAGEVIVLDERVD